LEPLWRVINFDDDRIYQTTLNPGFTHPCARSARQRNIITYKEVSGQARNDKAVKVATAQTL
jgi:hypothetical protein